MAFRVSLQYNWSEVDNSMSFEGTHRYKHNSIYETGQSKDEIVMWRLAGFAQMRNGDLLYSDRNSGAISLVRTFICACL